MVSIVNLQRRSVAVMLQACCHLEVRHLTELHICIWFWNPAELFMLIGSSHDVVGSYGCCGLCAMCTGCAITGCTY